jgi:RNA polymerase sigma-70 factor (ECF subfamily)
VSTERKDIARSEIEALYRCHGPAVFRRAMAILGNEAAAADAVQDVFIRALDHHAEFRGESSPMTWLYRITTNLCLNRLRDEKRRRELDQESVQQETVTGRRLEVTPDVRNLLRTLPPKVAQAGVYYYVDGMTHEEIAALLGVSRRTAGNCVDRFQMVAKKRLGRSMS